MYIQGFIIAVPEGRKDDYVRLARDVDPMFAEFGATEIMEAWEEDVPDGQVTDFRKAVNAKPDEKIVFSWMVWPDKATCETAHEKMMSDERFKEMPADMPFDGKRMVFGGFAPVFTFGR
ncbi:MAG: DUF1428 domain-containing protein [Novosphingobium sp.]|nr:DUF1428 domain-containing protein [Novosphingobium sp.]